MTKELFEKYADLKAQEKSIAEELKTLGPQLLLEMQKEEADKVSTDAGDFIIVKRKEWQYSSSVEEAAAGLKSMRQEEEQTGVAKFTIKENLMFKAKS